MEKDANIQLLEELIDMSLQRLIAAGNLRRKLLNNRSNGGIISCTINALPRG